MTAEEIVLGGYKNFAEGDMGHSQKYITLNVK